MTATTIAERKASLEATISRICGASVEITVRGLRSFTLSAEGDADLTAGVKFLSLSGQTVNMVREYDAECDLTCVYFDVR